MEYRTPEYMGYRELTERLVEEQIKIELAQRAISDSLAYVSRLQASVQSGSSSCREAQADPDLSPPESPEA